MTESEFHALVPNQRVQREGKEFVVVKKETRDVVCHPKGRPNFLVLFPPQQAPSMAKIESQPDVLDRPQSSHGFPALERPTPKLPVPHMPGQTQNLVCMALDVSTRIHNWIADSWCVRVFGQCREGGY
jgi:hypothetical protein